MYNLKKRTQILLSSVSVATILLFLLQFHSKQFHPPNKTLHIHRHLQTAHSICEDTIHHDLCVSTLASIPDLSSKSIPQIISSTINVTVAVVHSSASNCSGIRRDLRSLSPIQKQALDDCLELFDNTVDKLHTCLSELYKNQSLMRIYDLQTLLSAARTNQYTCLDGFSHGDNGAHHQKIIRPLIEDRLNHVSHLVSNALAIVKKLPKTKRSEEAFEGYGEMVEGFPSWISKKDRRLLQTNANTTKANLIVAKDGSGNYTTISDAVEATPNNTKGRFVIYIKQGAYFENVDVGRKKTNLMFIGDGIGKTVVKASRNVVDNSTTFRSATFAAVGGGFIARDITFENSAGPSKHQAVALRSGSDLSVFYRCSFVAYQDTLYVHSLRQFYRECDIYGTIDFIFGNAAVVFQKCNLYARKPNPNQQNIYTAQGREDPNENTGISIQNCKVAAASDLLQSNSSVKTFLGRPWKNYSRTVFMESFIDSLVDPAGWLEWNGSFALSTLYYGEYKNRGPGANTTARVKWPGYRVITNATEASQFTVANFIEGNIWLNSTSVPFYSGFS